MYQKLCIKSSAPRSYPSLIPLLSQPLTEELERSDDDHSIQDVDLSPFQNHRFTFMRLER